jgi:hypothetical protein
MVNDLLLFGSPRMDTLPSSQQPICQSIFYGIMLVLQITPITLNCQSLGFSEVLRVRWPDHGLVVGVTWQAGCDAIVEMWHICENRSPRRVGEGFCVSRMALESKNPEIPPALAGGTLVST